MWITHTKTWEKISGPQHGQGVHVTNVLLCLLVHVVVLCIRSNSFDNGLQATVLSQVSATEFLFSLLTNKKSHFKFSGENFIFRYWRHLVRAQKAMKEEMAENRFVFDAFVSYTRNDQKWVIKELLQRVEYESNIKLCLHQRYEN